MNIIWLHERTNDLFQSKIYLRYLKSLRGNHTRGIELTISLVKEISIK